MARDPLEELLRLSRRLTVGRPRVEPVRWRPAADIFRTREGWLVKLELAGVRPEEVEVRAHGRSLCVVGRRCDHERVEADDFYSLEIAYSYFEREIELPVRLEGKQIRVEARDGMLLVRILTQEGLET